MRSGIPEGNLKYSGFFTGGTDCLVSLVKNTNDQMQTEGVAI